MVPSARLIWLVAAIGFPAAIVAAVLPGERRIAVAAICLIALLAVIDALVRSRSLDGISMVTPEFARFYKDREGRIVIRILNRSRRARCVRVGLVAPEGIETPSEEQVVDLPADADAAEFSWTFLPRRRGKYRFESCYLEAASPLGLWLARRRDAISFELRVYPNLRRYNDLKALRRGVEGLHSFRQIGRGRDFEKLREYIPGDSFDEIHWKATARRGRPVTKVFQVERTQEIYVIIDASRLSARPAGDESALERSLTAGLIAGAAAERRGDLFGLAAFSDRVESFTRARNGKAHYAACRDAIYELQPRSVSPDFDEIATFLRLRLRRRALLFFLTSLDDPALAENFSRATKLLARRHLVIAGMLRPASARELFHDAQVESTEDIYRRLAGHLSWRQLRELEGTLARQGVRLALMEPESLTGGLIGLYDEVKQRQLL